MSGLNIRELRVTHHGFHPLEYLLRTVSVKICVIAMLACLLVLRIWWCLKPVAPPRCGVGDAFETHSSFMQIDSVER